ncbi:hypothetical protein N9173_01470 [bacterium]|nr:hypothetical protein [bacterium]
MNLRTLIVFAGLTLISPCVADLATALQPLYKPDIASARIAVKNIEQFAKTATSGGKEAADLGKSIKGLYSAEFKLLKAIENQNKQENEALKQDKSSRDWMDRTSMNPGGHPRHARSAIVKAAKIRQDAAMIVAKADDALVTAMTRINEHIKVLFEAEDLESTYILCSSIKAMNDRFFQKSPFKLSVSADVLKKFEVFIAKRPATPLSRPQASACSPFSRPPSRVHHPPSRSTPLDTKALPSPETATSAPLPHPTKNREQKDAVDFGLRSAP